MITAAKGIDPKIEFLMMNGNIDVTKNQELYEFAIMHGIRQINEENLKPDLITRKKRRREPGQELQLQWENIEMGFDIQYGMEA